MSLGEDEKDLILKLIDKTRSELRSNLPRISYFNKSTRPIRQAIDDVYSSLGRIEKEIKNYESLKDDMPGLLEKTFFIYKASDANPSACPALQKALKKNLSDRYDRIVSDSGRG